jgi:hypothetical protein
MNRFLYSNIEEKTDCKMHTFNEEDAEFECKALTYLVCKNELCPFYKPKKKTKE